MTSPIARSVLAVILLCTPALAGAASAQEPGAAADTAGPALARPGPVADTLGPILPGAREVTLKEAVRTAERSNPALTEAAEQIQLARSDRTGALGAFLPSLNLGYGFSESSTARLDPTQQSLTRSAFTSQLTGSVTLFDGFRRFDRLESARTTVDARLASYEQRRYETILSVKTAFFNAVAAQEQRAVELARVRRQLDQLDFVRQRIQRGQATRSDSLNTRVALNDARLALLNARNEARQAAYALAEAMGVEEPVRPAEEATLDPAPLPLEREEIMRIAVERAPELRSARLTAEAAEDQVDAEQSGYLPSLSLSGGFDWQEGNFPPGNRSWSYRLTGSLPLFDGLQRETRIARAKDQADIGLARVRQARLSVRRTVDQAYSQAETALAGLRLAEESVELAREDLRVIQQRYRLGVATILDLQDRQIALAEAETNVIRRKFDHRVAISRLESILGAPLGEVHAERTGTMETQ